ncbi:MAG: hypothetical protein ABSA97_09015 [Verrucomicrobiia bacterium]
MEGLRGQHRDGHHDVELFISAISAASHSASSLSLIELPAPISLPLLQTILMSL